MVIYLKKMSRVSSALGTNRKFRSDKILKSIIKLLIEK